MQTTTVNDRIAEFLKNGGAITICRTAKALGVKKSVMKLTTNRSSVNRAASRSEFPLGYSQVNYSRLQDSRQACALGKVGLGN
jgi:hypothetical protein